MTSESNSGRSLSEIELEVLAEGQEWMRQRLEQKLRQEFFFSSRRRHTRYIGDWSSDVCSSDLAVEPPGRSRCDHDGGEAEEGLGEAGVDDGEVELDQDDAQAAEDALQDDGGEDGVGRSEERRVGKEGRWRRGAGKAADVGGGEG